MTDWTQMPPRADGLGSGWGGCFTEQQARSSKKPPYSRPATSHAQAWGGGARARESLTLSCLEHAGGMRKPS